MPSSRPEAARAGRRHLLRAGWALGLDLGLRGGGHAARIARGVAGGAAGLAAGASQASEDAIADLLRQGGLVMAFRHALAPGTFDPPGFRLDDCHSQRNLSEAGRAQARQIGAWFETRGLRPARVRSSPWCRCLDTARLAFGTAETWPALGSPHGAREGTNAENLAALRQALSEASDAPGRFEVWVTHMFVLADLGLGGASSGEGLLLRARPAGQVELVGRLAAPRLTP